MKSIHGMGVRSLYALVISIIASLLGASHRPIVESLSFNLGAVFRNRALLQTDLTNEQRNAAAGLAIKWFQLSGRVPAVPTTLGFPVQTIYTVGASELARRDLSGDGGIQLGIQRGLKRQPTALRLTGFPLDMDGPCWTLLTTCGNSTRIEQASLIGFVLATSERGKVILMPVRMGIDTAEWAYDFPDIPPRHHKPPHNIPLEGGKGLGYLMHFQVDEGDRVEALSLVLSHPYRWETSPGHVIEANWALLSLVVTDADSAGDCRGSWQKLLEKMQYENSH